MYATNASFTRKMKKGRPCTFKMQDRSHIELKKQELFEKYEARKEAMNLISLAYSFGKLSKEEYDIACFLEQLVHKAQKGLGVKKLPTSAANTWNVSLQNTWNTINAGYENIHAQNCWKRIRDFVSTKDPKHAQEFFNILTTHYSYEDLQAVKINTFSITDILKNGLQLVKQMFDLGYL